MTDYTIKNSLTDAQVTVIMAVYNSCKTLNRAIDSVLNQSYSQWKLICVNDGSTDNSIDILNQYADLDNRIKVVSKSNGGPALARSMAFNMIETPYTIILDSDDMFSPDLLENCINKAIKTHADAIVPNALIEQADGSYMNWNTRFKIDTSKCLNGVEAFSKTFIHASMHGLNLWKTDLVKKYGIIKNSATLSLNEDEYIQRLLFLHSQTIHFTSNGFYIYKYNDNSITKSFSISHLGYLHTCKRLIALSEDTEYPIADELKAHIKENYFRAIIALQIRYEKYKNNLNLKDRIHFKEVIKTNYIKSLAYKSNYQFKDKKYPQFYRLSSTNGYFIFRLTCFLFSHLKK